MGVAISGIWDRRRKAFVASYASDLSTRVVLEIHDSARAEVGHDDLLVVPMDRAAEMYAGGDPAAQQSLDLGE